MKTVFLPLLLFILCLTLPAAAATTLHELARTSQSAGITDGCAGHLVKNHGLSPATVEKSLAAEVGEFRFLAERALMLRAETIKVGKEIKLKQEAGQPLTGEDLDTLNQGIVEHLALRKELLAVAEAHECWLDGSDKDLLKLGITPETRLKGVMLSLSSALVLYDNYLLAISLFEGDSKLRRLLNERDPGYAVKAAELAKITLNYDSVTNRQRVRKAMKYVEKEAARHRSALDKSPEMGYVTALITQSPSYTMVRRISPFYVVGRKLGFFGAVTSDTLSGMEREGVNLFSMVFGNAVGLVETRKGKLNGRGEVLAQVRETLKAGDILLEKTPFRLTDKLIPGYWGHAAVWLGTEAELRELGVWDNPVVVRYHREIQEGRLVVEALRSGVEMNTLDHFFNIDSLGVLRKPEMSREARARTLIQALRQVGKPYDFNFDVETKERVYCSKLVYLSYSGVQWPTRRSLGRSTITPDDVALKAAGSGDLQLVAFYHDGKRVSERALDRMSELMAVDKRERISFYRTQ